MATGSWFDALTHPRVRDLAWSLLCPPLHAFGPQPPPGLDPMKAIPDLLQLDKDPLPLETFLAEDPARRLGLYHEQLLHYHLSRQPQVADLQRGLAVRKAGITLGELDFLYRAHPHPGYLHLEVAFKFFLRINGQWLGVNPRDSLARKVARMETHQLPLSAGETFRNQQAPDRVVAQRLGWIKGCLFEPWTDYEHPMTKNAGGERWRGWWLYADQLSQLPQGRYRLLEGDRRLSPAREADLGRLLDRETLEREDFLRPRMLARMEPRDQAWDEMDRGLVMPRHWPAIR